MHSLYLNLQAALMMLTRIPCFSASVQAQLTEQHFKQCWPFFPVVGFIVGTFSAAILLISTLFLPALPSVILSILVSCVITGAIHEDGFADACDGLFSGKPAEQAFNIMKDSQLGTYGVLGLLFNTTLKISLIFNLAHNNMAYACLALILSHCFGRFSPLIIMHHLSPTYSSNSKLSNNLSRPTQYQLIALLIAIIASLTSLFWFSQLILSLNVLFITSAVSILVSTGIMLGSSISCAIYLDKKLQRYNGDCLGFTEQCSEIMILLGLTLYLL